MVFRRIYARYILSLLCIVVPVMMIWSLYKLVNITDYEFVVTEYIDEMTQKAETLPFSHISTPYISNSQLTIRGSFAVNLLELKEEIHFFAPSSSGHFVILSDDQILFSNIENKPFPLLNVGNNISFSTSSAPSSTMIVDFILTDDETPFVGLSQIYVGTAEQMLKAAKRIEFYNIFLRKVYWGAEAIGIITLMALFAFAGVREYSAPALMIFLYLFATQSPGVLSEYLDITGFIPHINSFAFIAILGIVRFYRQISYQEKEKARPKELSIALAMSIIALFLCIYYPLLGRSFHLFITFPCLVLSLFIVAVLSIVNTFISGRIETAIFAAGSLAVSLSIFHDILARIGYIDTSVFLNGTASFCFFICAVFLLLSRVQRSNQMILDQKASVEKALEERTGELMDQFVIQAELREQNAVAIENRRITRDLHDGVLTYLSIIQSLSERSQESDWMDINSLAKNATREIRVIIDSEAFDQNSVFLTLSGLRNQVVEPLRNTGIHVDWDLLPLLDQSIIDPMHALDLFRIIQEAIHNAVHRAMCRSLAIYAELDAIESEIRIYVVNKGGIALKPDSFEGNGIRNMRRRTASMGGIFCLTPIPGGAELLLFFPSKPAVST